MEAKDIITKLRNYEEENLEDYGSVESMIGNGEVDQEKFRTEFGAFNWECVYKRSDTGDHDTVETVIYFMEHDIYIRISAYYSSHGGTYWSEGEFEQVYPRTKTVKYYTKKKPDEEATH